MRPARAVWAAAAAYAALYALLGWDRYATFHAGSDLGLFTQTIASAASGFSNTTEGGSHFTYHFSPLLVLCAPVLLAAHSPLSLVVVQAAAGALVAPPLFWIARRRADERLAFAIACVALLYPPLAGVTFADFHENGFAPALTVWLLWAVDARRFGLAALFFACALGLKEDQAPILACDAGLAALVYARRGDRTGTLVAISGAIVAAATFVAFFALVRPLAGAHDAWNPTHFYRDVGPGWASIGRPAYALEAFVTLCFVPFASPAVAFAFPPFAELLLSHDPITYTMGQHYAGIWIGYVLFAFALGSCGIAARAPRLGRRLVRASLALCLLVLVVASPTHWGHYLRLPNEHDAALAKALRRLPPDLAVGAPEEIYAHLGFDPHAELGLARSPRYALLDAALATSFLEKEWEPVVSRGLRDGTYRAVWREGSIALYERR